MPPPLAVSCKKTNAYDQQALLADIARGESGEPRIPVPKRERDDGGFRVTWSTGFGLGAIGAGVLLFTVGGFVAMVRHPRAFSDSNRYLFDPSREGVDKEAPETFSNLQMNDPKAKWFSRLGMALFLIGMMVLFFSNGFGRAERCPDSALDGGDFPGFVFLMLPDRQLCHMFRQESFPVLKEATP